MSNRPAILRAGIITGALLVPLSLAACSSSTKTADAGAAGSTSASSMSSSAMNSMSSSSAMSGSTTPFGAACASVPASGAGSFDGMSTAPVATAASANPVLKTLVTAVGAAGLGDALNTQKAITVFAPANSAFAKVPAATLKGLLADKAALTKTLTYHVLPERLAPDQLAGTHKTLEGGDLTVAGSGSSFTVGTGKANVVCGNVQTANATVYIIDSVLTPPAS